MRKLLSFLLLTLVFSVLGGALATGRAPAERKAPDPESGAPARPTRGAEGESRPPTAAPDAAPSGAADPALREILEIHRQQGDLLDGTLLDSPASGCGPAGTAPGAEDDSEFLQMLQKAASEAKPLQRPAGDASPAGEASPAGRWAACQANYQRRVQAEKSGDDRLIGLLRAASRRLDRKANSLEAERRFDQADQLRELAQRTRLEARRLEGVWTAPCGDRAQFPDLLGGLPRAH